MKVFRVLAVTSALLAVVVALLGSWVRINNAGLTCPDWPLCRGQLVPALFGGVTLEWSHRATALVESLTVLAVIGAGWRCRRAVAGIAPALAALGVIFALQVILGGATVRLGNSPLSVMLHWAMGMALVGTLTLLAVLAIAGPALASVRGAGLGSGTAPALTLAALLAFATMSAGAFVSSSYAGLACPDFPLCGETFTFGAAQIAQMLHRVAAAGSAFAAAGATVATFTGASPRVRAFASTGLALVAVQIALGAANVVWRLPLALREAHAANAVVTFLAFVIAATLAALEPVRAAQRAPEHALARGAAPVS